MMTFGSRPIRHALISVNDKTGIVPFASALAARGVTLISTGGSARTLTAAGLEVTEVAEVTGVAEFLDGRVKTLHPVIHGGLLARRDRPDHLAALAERGIAPIDLLVCNLYPFAQTVASGASSEDSIENIDIGGVALIRAAAKNHDAVTVVSDPADYEHMLAEFTTGEGSVGIEMRRVLARKAFAMTAAYDAAIAAWMARAETVTFPENMVLAGRLAQRLRYGENPHQSAAFAIVKHANACGAAIGTSLREAWDKALACDPVSAFGGIVAVNRPLDAATAEAIGRLHIEVVIAPQAEEGAISVLARKTSLRLLVTDDVPDTAAPGLTFRSLSGGILVQERDRLSVEKARLRIVTRREPSEIEI